MSALINLIGGSRGGGEGTGGVDGCENTSAACMLAFNAPGIASGWITGDNRWSLGFPALQSRSAQTQEKGRR